ncbi:MAG: class I SAM-dependent rRNA methyltransferase, partial [Solobacterium sp.]|nr:class I SAM-dependent rRNA methyltransferase [Solobacterium sp.]
MKTKRNFTRAEVTRKQEKRIREGHPWIYEDEITVMDTPDENGCLIDVFSSKGTYLGTGMYSEHSKIRIRLLGNNANEQYNDAFFLRRLKYALEYRMDVMGEDFANCRLIHGEADGLPGVTVDKYGPVLVSEISTYGMDIRKDLLYRGMKELLAEKGYEVSGIYERSDSELRTKEGLAKVTGWVTEYTEKEIPVLEINENRILYDVDIINGQKTGFFLDQKYNRLSVRKLAAGKNVLDCCTHTGSFAINAAYGKAAQVTALDVSETALDMARQNARKNHLEEKINFVQA